MCFKGVDWHNAFTQFATGIKLKSGLHYSNIECMYLYTKCYQNCKVSKWLRCVCSINVFRLNVVMFLCRMVLKWLRCVCIKCVSFQIECLSFECRYVFALAFED